MSLFTHLPTHTHVQTPTCHTGNACTHVHIHACTYTAVCAKSSHPSQKPVWWPDIELKKKVHLLLHSMVASKVAVNFLSQMKSLPTLFITKPWGNQTGFFIQFHLQLWNWNFIIFLQTVSITITRSDP